MAVLGYKISFWPFRRIGNGEIVAGVQIYKDWTHTCSFDFRYSLKEPHLTFCRTYTTKSEYVEVFTHFWPKKYRDKHGGLSFYAHSEYRQDLFNARCGCG